MNLAYYRRLAINLEAALRLLVGPLYPQDVDAVVKASKTSAAGHAGGVAGPRRPAPDEGVYDILKAHGLSAKDAGALTQQIVDLTGARADQESAREWRQVVQATARLLEAERYSDGMMVALYPEAGVVQAIAIEGGLEPEELHLTLAHVGTTDQYTEADIERFFEVVRALAVVHPPLAGKINGGGIFTGEDSEPGVVYASPDVPALPEFRQAVVEALARNGFETSIDHGFIPHITLAYHDHTTQSMSAVHAFDLPLRFSRLSAVAGTTRRDFPLLGGVVREAVERHEYTGAPAIVLQAEDADELQAGAEDALQRFRAWAAEEFPELVELLDARLAPTDGTP